MHTAICNGGAVQLGSPNQLHCPKYAQAHGSTALPRTTERFALQSCAAIVPVAPFARRRWRFLRERRSAGSREGPLGLLQSTRKAEYGFCPHEPPTASAGGRGGAPSGPAWWPQSTKTCYIPLSSGRPLNKGRSTMGEGKKGEGGGNRDQQCQCDNAIHIPNDTCSQRQHVTEAMYVSLSLLG